MRTSDSEKDPKNNHYPAYGQNLDVLTKKPILPTLHLAGPMVEVLPSELSVMLANLQLCPLFL